MLVAVAEGDYVTVPIEDPGPESEVPPEKMEAYLAEMEEKMREAARRFDFKQAAAYRDRLREIKSRVVLETGST
jgi:excinuclease ABC subunit B